MKTNTDLRHIYPVISGTLTGGNGTTYALDGHNIPGSSLSFKSGTSPAGTFAIGGAVISSVSFALLDAAGSFSSVVWKNAKVAFSLTCNQTVVNMGEYFIVNHSESGGVISVTAMDALKILDEYEMHELNNITYPTSIGALATAIASAHGLTVSGIRNPLRQIDDPGNDRMTQRACLSYLAQICGQYIQAKGSVLTFGWYDLSSPVDDGATFGHDWNTSDVTITGIRVSDAENSTTEDRGADGYRLEINSNPFIVPSNISSIADVIWASVNGISFRSGSAEILASPAFEAGDCVTVRTPDESNVKLLLTNITYTPDVSMSISSDADAQEGDLQLNKNPYVKPSEAKAEANDAISDQLSDPNSELSQAIAGAGGGGGGAIITLAGQSLTLPDTNATPTQYAAYRFGAKYQAKYMTIGSASYTLMEKLDLPATVTAITIAEQNVVIPAYTAGDSTKFPIHLTCGLTGAGNGQCDLTLRGYWVSADKIQLDILTGSRAGVNPYIVHWSGVDGAYDNFVKCAFNPCVLESNVCVALKYITKDATTGKWEFTKN